jgi:TonB-dependent SusC/RagA subfamily outer membrane receptor
MRIKIFFLILLSVLCLNSVTAQKNSKRMTITGSVVDVAKKPIVNAIIMIDNKKTNSITDSKGNYKIKVKSNASKIGIFTFGNGIIEEEINGRTRINFNFRTGTSRQLPDQDIAPGEEAINVGYKHVKKKNLNYPVSKIDGTNKKYASYSSIYDMIQREVSGVQVNGTTIVIQDSKNLWGYVPPLFVVDGIYVDTIEDIQPSVVESIEVLKGASAAIYGSRGYGGAILIKTKTGQINK